MASDAIFGLGLCAGALGLELGLELAIPGYRTVSLVERETAVAGRVAARVLEGSLPPVAVWDDVATFDGRPWRGIVDIVSAGFPCQPFSVAGKRMQTADHRWIWPDIARIIGEVEPSALFLENVPGLLLDPSSDPDRWEMDQEPDDALGGMGTVLRDLARLGFNAEWCCIRASDVRASHGRKRVFILGMAHAGCALLGRAAQSAGINRPWPSDHGGGASGALADSRYGQFQEPGRGAERRTGARPASAAMAEPTSARLPVGGDRDGLRELPPIERTGSELGDAQSGGWGERGEPSEESGRQSHGADAFLDHADSGHEPENREVPAGRHADSDASGQLENAARAVEPGRGSGWGRVREAGEPLGHPDRQREDTHEQASGSWDSVSDAGRELPIFAPGPGDPCGATCWCGSPGCDLRFHKRKLNPLFETWLMGWPLWWLTSAPEVSGPWAMEWYLYRLRSRLDFLLDGF